MMIQAQSEELHRHMDMHTVGSMQSGELKDVSTVDGKTSNSKKRNRTKEYVAKENTITWADVVKGVTTKDENNTVEKKNVSRAHSLETIQLTNYEV